MSERKYLSCAETAKLIRGALKKAFPGVKFSVRSSVYSMGASIDVGWTDGPATKAVEQVAKAYAGGGFDGMIDMAYSNEAWLMPDGSAAFASCEGTEGSRGVVPAGEAPAPSPEAVRVRFGADYVFCTKKFSTATFKAATEKVCTLYGVPQPPIEEGTEPYIKGGGPRVPQADGIDLATLVYRELRSEDRTFQEAQWAKEGA